ncbi:vWA domain-containing protein [Thermincola potens]|uniref:VWA containing CoxE family protein n=1 Tax=Thermincola potens (strain JR) TaxID=635013 RepID=D5XA48_THEPJ|nr:VWA domain-containing protein [Thermincola potens]ADG83181.1 VWA containing CoxE family protein [Thermincola potens JR]
MSHPAQENSTGRQRYIENSIVRFVDALRRLGLRISSAEVIDAVRGLQMVDIIDREQVLAVFQGTLAKDETSRKQVKRAFDAYFTNPENMEKRVAQYVEGQEKKAVEMQAAEKDLSFEWEQWGQDGESSGQLQLKLTDEEKQVYARLPEDKKQKIRDYLQSQFQGNRINSPEQLITNVVRSSLNYWKHRLRQEEAHPPFEVNYTGDPEMDSLLDEVVKQTIQEEDLLYEDMQKLADRDLPQVGVLIKKLSQKLATRISRRYRQSKKRSRLDLRRSIRHNMRYGGTLFKLDFKTRKPRKPRFLLIADVSGSMAKYAGFILQFIYGLSSTVEDIESFVFSEGVERITPYFRAGHPFDQTMTDIVNRSKEWGKGTDLYKALQVIENKYGTLLRPDTFLIILSDTKTLNYARAAEEMTKLRKKVKEIIWLNTLPKKSWDDTPSVQAFCARCLMYECNTLAHLERIMTSRMLK